MCPSKQPLPVLPSKEGLEGGSAAQAFWSVLRLQGLMPLCLVVWPSRRLPSSMPPARLGSPHWPWRGKQVLTTVMSEGAGILWQP